MMNREEMKKAIVKAMEINLQDYETEDQELILEGIEKISSNEDAQTVLNGDGLHKYTGEVPEKYEDGDAFVTVLVSSAGVLCLYQDEDGVYCVPHLGEFIEKEEGGGIDMKNKIYMVINNIVESGAINDFIEKINDIEVIDDRYYVCTMKSGQTFVFDMESGKVARLHRGIKFNPSHSYKWEDRVVWQYICQNPKENRRKRNERQTTQSDLPIHKLVPIIWEIVANNGRTRESYNGLEGNHLLPRDLEVDNSISNLEVTDGTSNKRHWQAWSKIQVLLGLSKQDRIRLQMSANDTALIAGILNKHTCYAGNFAHDYEQGQFLFPNGVDTIAVYTYGKVWNACII